MCYREDACRDAGLAPSLIAIAPCSECHGAGHVPVLAHFERVVEVECSECDGTGIDRSKLCDVCADDLVAATNTSGDRVCLACSAVEVAA